ncbi:hypothetical protein MKK69_04080 [Methylobacterium sp. J-026]|uniref:hypothetical protein n=1 Tax=Methylobacterium sp. J-026 TaxID=2836624 RepID=UPI001FBAC498|nr:hypothetical protein [Methylobacterium sp. J-026]MCJ2133251.1 hypothetical protein [Methylobacterium sp. J-026]
MHIADRTLRMSKPELVAFIQKGGERDAGTPASMFKALDAAQGTFEGWGKLLSLACARYMVAASSAVLGQEGGATKTAEPEPEPEPEVVEEPAHAHRLVAMLDLASASLSDLRAIQDMAENVEALADAYTWGPRCCLDSARSADPVFNEAGKLMRWIGDALADVQTAIRKEVSRRAPSTALEKETRLANSPIQPLGSRVGVSKM